MDIARRDARPQAVAVHTHTIHLPASIVLVGHLFDHNLTEIPMNISALLTKFADVVKDFAPQIEAKAETAVDTLVDKIGAKNPWVSATTTASNKAAIKGAIEGAVGFALDYLNRPTAVVAAKTATVEPVADAAAKVTVVA